MSDIVYKDNAASLLTTIINNTDDPATASITAGDGAKFPTIGTNSQNGQPNWFPVVVVRASDNAYEKMKATARSTDAFTLTRAQGGTSKLAFAVGDAIYLGNTKEYFDEFLTAQDAQYGKPHWCGTAGGTENAITVAASPTVTGLSAGLEVEFIGLLANTTTAVTIAVDGTTAKNVKDAAGGALNIGDIVVGGIYRAKYNGTEYRIVSGITPGNAITAAMSASTVTGFRNRLYNGEFKVDQRNGGASQTFTAGAALAYCVDNWYGYCTGANVQGQQLSPNGGMAPPYLYQFTGAASVTGIGFGQRIEAINSADMAGKTITLSAKLAVTGLGVVSWAIYSPSVALNAFGTLAAPTRTLIASGTFAATSTLTKFSKTLNSISTAWYLGMEVVFSVGALTSGTFKIAEVQLEVASAASEFEHVDYATELHRCQRYYETGLYGQVLPIANASVVGSYYSHVDFKSTKFAVPTITGTNDQGGTFASTSVTVDGMLVGRSTVVADRSNSGTWTASAVIP